MVVLNQSMHFECPTALYTMGLGMYTHLMSYKQEPRVVGKGGEGRIN